MAKADGSIFFTDSVLRSGYSLTNQFAEHMEFLLVKNRLTATEYDYYLALSYAVKDRLVRNWLRTQQHYTEQDSKHVYYLSLEFLMGRLLGNTLINIGYYSECRDILQRNGLILENIMELEYDMGLGNGGLGRLAACFLDSMATLRLPASGYGIRYEFGIFRQEIRDGFQVEQPDNWLSFGHPWETQRRELTFRIQFGGRVDVQESKGRKLFRWVDTDDVLAVAYDIPVPGYQSNTVNNLRLWQARSTNEFRFGEFNEGNYLAAVENKNFSENISKVLYPNDSSTQGKRLRLQQEFFFVSASLQDILEKYLRKRDTLDELPDQVFIQLNDTHPVVAIPELMRLLIDVHLLEWDQAWAIVQKTFGYTNHTVVPEALEEWSVELFESLLPRHLQIIYEINRRFLEDVRRRYSDDPEVVRDLSIIREQPNRTIRMANLAIVAAAAVNGVAELHTNILKTRIFPHFHRFFPGKFRNVTNGISPRRWLKVANPLLANLITEQIGEEWVTDLRQLRKLEDRVTDEEFVLAWAAAKNAQKLLLKQHIERELDITVNPGSMFDSQVKRFHLYKRQLLNVLHVVTLYNRLRKGIEPDGVPRTVIFAGKAAPAYQQAKLVIKLIHAVAERVNSDPEIKRRLQVVFLPNYSVSLAEKIIPATDLSEQISTAGYEASGTGNMKFALNGALTIGTLDGANIEMMEEIGRENMFIFGLDSKGVVGLRDSGYRASDYIEANPELQEVLEMIGNGYFTPQDPGLFGSLVDELRNQDYYCLMADYAAYIETQSQVNRLFANPSEWHRKSILNAARIGKFSSDRSIGEYNDQIWHCVPVEIAGDEMGPI